MIELYLKSVDGLGPCHPISFHCSEIKPFRATSGKAASHNALKASCTCRTDNVNHLLIDQILGEKKPFKIRQISRNLCPCTEFFFLKKKK